MHLFSIEKYELPNESLLARYCPRSLNSNGVGYCDCYAVTVNGAVNLEEYVYHFYSSPIFKLERWILRVAVDLPSTDWQVELLATGRADNLAAWLVEERRANQLLLCDMSGRTRSWLMRHEFYENQVIKTRLLFGSAVLPVIDPNTGNQKLGIVFTALLGFHKLYSRLLLVSARKKITKYQRRIKG